MNKEREKERYYRSLDNVEKKLISLGLNPSSSEIIEVYKAELNSIGDLSGVKEIDSIQSVIDELNNFY